MYQLIFFDEQSSYELAYLKKIWRLNPENPFSNVVETERTVCV